MNNVFAITKSYLTARGIPDYSKSEYCRLSISKKHGWQLRVEELTSEETKKIMASNSMVKVLCSVFELPISHLRTNVKNME